MLDPSGFSLAGCRYQTVGYGAASLHCHAGIQWKTKKEFNSGQLPIFISCFSLSQLFSFFHKGIAKQRDIHRRFEVIESYLVETERRNV